MNFNKFFVLNFLDVGSERRYCYVEELQTYLLSGESTTSPGECRQLLCTRDLKLRERT